MDPRPAPASTIEDRREWIADVAQEFCTKLDLPPPKIIFEEHPVFPDHLFVWQDRPNFKGLRPILEDPTILHISPANLVRETPAELRYRVASCLLQTRTRKPEALNLILFLSYLFLPAIALILLLMRFGLPSWFAIPASLLWLPLAVQSITASVSPFARRSFKRSLGVGVDVDAAVAVTIRDLKNLPLPMPNMNPRIQRSTKRWAEREIRWLESSRRTLQERTP